MLYAVAVVAPAAAARYRLRWYSGASVVATIAAVENITGHCRGSRSRTDAGVCVATAYTVTSTAAASIVVAAVPATKLVTVAAAPCNQTIFLWTGNYY